MPRFNLDDYETVESRIHRFYEKYPKGRIITKLVKVMHDGACCVFRAKVYTGDTGYNEPTATGYAEEHKGGNGPNKDCWFENCETSAIGRALANMGMSGDKRTSREEMQKVNAHEEAGKSLDKAKQELLADAMRYIDAPKKDAAAWLGKVVEVAFSKKTLAGVEEVNVIKDMIAQNKLDTQDGTVIPL